MDWRACTCLILWAWRALACRMTNCWVGGVSYHQGGLAAHSTRSRSTPPLLPCAGPIISARVGDVVTVVFRNALDFPVNLVPTGFVPEALDDPAAAANFTAAVPANTTVTLQFRVPQDAGPQSYEADTKLWLYK